MHRTRKDAAATGGVVSEMVAAMKAASNREMPVPWDLGETRSFFFVPTTSLILCNTLCDLHQAYKVGGWRDHGSFVPTPAPLVIETHEDGSPMTETEKQQARLDAKNESARRLRVGCIANFDTWEADGAIVMLDTDYGHFLAKMEADLKRAARMGTA